MTWGKRRFIRDPVDPETFDPERKDYTNLELEDYADAFLKKEIKEGRASLKGEDPILFEEHLYNKRRREILVGSGTPDEIQGLDNERGVIKGDGQKIYWRSHPRGRKVNSEKARKEQGASWFR